MPITDILFTIIGLFLFYRGWSKGFLGSLIGPLSLLIGLILASLYYKAFGQMWHAFIISIIAPMLIGFIAKHFLSLYTKDEKGESKEPSIAVFSRAAGGIFNFVCGGSVVLLLLAGTHMALGFQANVTKSGWAARVYNDIEASSTFTMIKPVIGLMADKSGLSALAVLSSDKMTDPKTIKKLQNNPAIQQLQQDEDFQAIAQDQELQQFIQNGNYKELLSNPRMRALVEKISQNPQMLSDILKAYQDIQ